MKQVRLRTLFFAGWLGIFCLITAAEDWPLWRGPDGSGVSREKNWNPRGITRVLWRKSLGVGYSSVSVMGNRVYTMGNVGNQDIVYCLNADNGEEIWRFSYPCPAGGGYAGPRATPVTDGKNVYTFSQDGQVHCLRAGDGRKVWQTQITSFGARNVAWKFTSSPCLTGKLVLLNAGEHGVALDKKTGKPVWISSGSGGYAVAVARKIGNKRLGFFFGKDKLFAVKVKTGRVLWSFPWKVEYNVNAATPIVTNKWAFISSGYGKGCALLDITKAAPKLLWQNTNLCSHFSSPVYLDGYIYGVTGNAGRGKLTCISLKTGRSQWTRNLGFGSFMVADDKIIYLNERGKLFIGKISPQGFTEIASAQVLRGAGKCWNMPVLSNGRIYCRGQRGKMVCLDVRGSSSGGTAGQRKRK